MNKLPQKEFNGIEITFDSKENVSLTDIWKAGNMLENKRPADWLRLPQTQKFIEIVGKSSKVGKSHIDLVKQNRGGKNPGTWAHWQIALSYAQYLSPELHMFVNQCFVERLQEEKNPELAYSKGKERAIKTWKKQGKTDEWIVQRFRAIEACKTDNKVLQEHGDDNMVFAMCANALNKEILGMTAKEFKEENNLPANAVTREHLDDIQLAEIALASLVSSKRIVDQNVRGNTNCSNVHSVVASKITRAIR